MTLQNKPMKHCTLKARPILKDREAGQRNVETTDGETARHKHSRQHHRAVTATTTVTITKTTSIQGIHNSTGSPWFVVDRKRRRKRSFEQFTMSLRLIMTAKYIERSQHSPTNHEVVGCQIRRHRGHGDPARWWRARNHLLAGSLPADKQG